MPTTKRPETALLKERFVVAGIGVAVGVGVRVIEGVGEIVGLRVRVGVHVGRLGGKVGDEVNVGIGRRDGRTLVVFTLVLLVGRRSGP